MWLRCSGHSVVHGVEASVLCAVGIVHGAAVACTQWVRICVRCSDPSRCVATSRACVHHPCETTPAALQFSSAGEACEDPDTALVDPSSQLAPEIEEDIRAAAGLLMLPPATLVRRMVVAVVVVHML